MITVQMTLKPVTLDASLVVTAYNGTTGCACGCGGSYAAQGDGPSALRTINTRLRKVQQAIDAGTVEIQAPYASDGEWIYMTPESETGRVTRVYSRQSPFAEVAA